jgi:dihydroxy-acid dehydratase
LQKHPFKFPASQTPWQQIQREMVAQFDEGMVLKPAVKFQKLAQTAGTPRDNH